MNDGHEQPFDSPHQWDQFVEKEVYPSESTKRAGEFRDYSGARPEVREFYRLNHRHQTVDFVENQRELWLPPRRKRLTIADALVELNTLVDDSDPDIELDQLQHLLQTAEAIRTDGHEDWFVLTGLIHDLEKLLCLFGSPQWAVVGDTFPVGCRFREEIIFSDYFADNPDSEDARYLTDNGIYAPHCGLENLRMSWGHDEYLYQVLKPYLPLPALYMIRYHSFYAWHREEAYFEFCTSQDHEMLNWVRTFNRYDLYSKSDVPPDWQKLAPYYHGLIEKYLPGAIQFDVVAPRVPFLVPDLPVGSSMIQAFPIALL